MTLAAENVSMCKITSCFQIRSNVQLYGDFIYNTLKSFISGTKILTQDIIMTDCYSLDVFWPLEETEQLHQDLESKLHLTEEILH